jgi:hypothetical protein
MYYPYLRSKQFELLALREFAEKNPNNQIIIPIIEPVKTSYTGLNKALETLIGYDMEAVLILNPKVGDLINHTDIYSKISPSVKDSGHLRPAFIIDYHTNYNELVQVITENYLNRVVLIVSHIRDIEDADFINLYQSPNIEHVVIEGINRSLKSRLLSNRKEVITLKDNFNQLKRNSDYAEVVEEDFTQDHYFYSEENYAGFSDYTTIGKEFSDGGRLPYAVAIHFTYSKNEEQICIRHFVSDSNDDNSNIQGKFGEAVKKAVDFFDKKEIHTYASEEIRNYYTESKYPGLGTLKKVSIKNHLEVILNALKKQ